jgi:hypothetical protein
MSRDESRLSSYILFLSYDFPLYCLLVVRASTGRAQSVHVVLDIVEAELADLVQESYDQ